MMARSRRSNQRPDTVMQDRINQVDETSCTARPDHTVGSNSDVRMLNPDVGFALNNRHRQPSLSAPKSANNGLSTAENGILFDHMISAYKERLRNGETKRFCG